MSQFLNALNNFIWGPPLIILMIVTGAYFTIRSGFFQVRHLGYIFHHTLGRLFHHDEEPGEEKGLLTPYEAIATAVGGSVGFGNIAGVATAVTHRRPRRGVLDVADRFPGHAHQAGGGVAGGVLPPHR